MKKLLAKIPAWRIICEYCIARQAYQIGLLWEENPSKRAGGRRFLHGYIITVWDERY